MEKITINIPAEQKELFQKYEFEADIRFRLCPCCNKLKDLSAFTNTHSWCVKCRREHSKKYYHERKERKARKAREEQHKATDLNEDEQYYVKRRGRKPKNTNNIKNDENKN